MKKLSLILVSLSIISLFSQCGKDPGDKKLKSPSTGYKYYISSDSTKKENPDTVINTQTLVFEATNFDGADYYSVFVGSYNIGTSNGVTLEKNTETKVFSITHDAISVPGTYKIYMVATNVNLTTGKIKRVVDSSKTIVVVDPTLSQAVITGFNISQAGFASINCAVLKVLVLKDVAKTKVSLPIKATITADSILYENVNPKYFPIFRSVYFDAKATSDLIFINDSTHQDTYSPLSMNTSKGNYLFKGCKIKIQSKDGTATKIYPIAVRYLKI